MGDKRSRSEPELRRRLPESSKARPPLAAMIRRARRSLDLRQEDVAGALGVKQGAVSAWENGTTTPSTPNLRRLAELLELDVRTLLDAAAGVDPEPAEAAAS